MFEAAIRAASLKKDVCWTTTETGPAQSKRRPGLDCQAPELLPDTGPVKIQFRSKNCGESDSWSQPACSRPGAGMAEFCLCPGKDGSSSADRYSSAFATSSNCQNDVDS